MKHTRLSFSKAACLLLAAAILLGSCSRRAHMPRHRKRRNCDCPTFSMNANVEHPHGLCHYQSI